jgi:hypothetical protein
MALAVCLVFGIGIGLLFWQVSRLQERLYQESAIESARLYNEAIATFRTLYTSEVVNTVTQHGFEVTHDYRTREKAIPLPATLSMLFGREVGRSESGAETFLYSGFPFPWRQAEHDVLFVDGTDGGSTFAARAWQHWQEHPADEGGLLRVRRRQATLRDRGPDAVGLYGVSQHGGRVAEDRLGGG